MRKEEIINKVLSEYYRYGITKECVEIVYNLAVIIGIPDELYYEGIRYLFNDFLGINNAVTTNNLGKAFLEYGFNNTKTNNLNINDEEVNRNIANEIIKEGINKIGERLKGSPVDVKIAIEENLKQFVKDHI